MKTRIKELRKQRGWTQEHLAALIGVVKSHVSEMETGKKNPSGPLLDKLAEVFETTVPNIYDQQDGSDVASLVQAFNDLGEDDQKSVLQHARALAGKVGG